MGTDSWLGVELRHFLALEAVAREGSFGKAATSLGYTQSAVSQQIATLERIVGHRLIERPGGPKPVSLTEAGQLLLTHAGAIAARVAAAQADLTALAEGQAGTLRVGVFQSVGQRILPEVMTRFFAAWPQVNVTLTESADDLELLGLVERGRARSDVRRPAADRRPVRVRGAACATRTCSSSRPAPRSRNATHPPRGATWPSSI